MASKMTNLLKNQLKNDEQNLLGGLHKYEEFKKQNTQRHQNMKNLKKKKSTKLPKKSPKMTKKLAKEPAKK
ncbi:4122_t:CDS:1, partial [Dentiscutata erythropus]